MRLQVVVTIALLFTSASFANPTLEVEELPDRMFRLTLTTQEPMDVSVAQQGMFPIATKLCGGMSPKYGRYQFEKIEAVDGGGSDDGESFVLIQDIECEMGVAGATAEPSRTLSQDENRAIKDTVRGLTREFLDGQIEGDDEGTYAMLSQSMQSMAPFDTWKSEREDFRRIAGSANVTDIWRVSVYVDPPSGPGPGIYVAADYQASYEEVPFRCGYVVWLEQPDRSFRAIREELGFVEASMISELSSEEIQNIKGQLGCPPPDELGQPSSE